MFKREKPAKAARRPALREEIADRLNLPAGAAGVVRVTLMGARRALIEDHRGIAIRASGWR